MNEIQITNLDRDTKRFLAAKEAMGAILLASWKANINATELGYKTSSEVIAAASVQAADALLEALQIKEDKS